MGLFDKFFTKKKQTVTSVGCIEKTAETLDESIFWKIVDDSVIKTGDQEEQEEFLIKEISKLSLKEIVGFRLYTDKLLYDTYNSKMWCAGYIMNGGCSDDGFEYFRNWVISRGKEVFFLAKENPDSLISQIEFGEEGIFEFESFWYVALEAFNRRTGKDLYDFIDEDKFSTKEGNYPSFEFDWEEDRPETLQKLCPQLFEHFY